jgi:L-threonylcarbamoyladenylate synthase
VIDDLGEQTPLLLDGGPCEVGVESTIVDLTGTQARLLRPGRIRREAIEAVLGEPLGGQDASAPRASGTLASHYCPVTPVSVVDEDRLDAALLELAEANGVSGVSAFGRSGPLDVNLGVNRGVNLGVYSRQRPLDPKVLWLAAPSDADGWEQTLYDAMRQLDQQQLTRIVIAAPREGPQWDAVMDRVSRAAVRS